MAAGRVLTDETEIRALLEQVNTIAVLGVSPKPDRDSHRVAKYLQEKGYRIIPIRPKQKTILGEPVYDSLEAVPEPVDIVDVFRRPEQIPAHAEEALRINPKAFWMQLGIENKEAADLLTQNGIHVVMNRCIKIEHARLIP